MNCDLLEADRPIALCDPGDVALSGTAYRDPTADLPTFPLQDRVSFPHPIAGLGAPTGWTTALGNIPDQHVLVVIAVCLDLTP
ncbi:MAG: hypothetical protein DWQ36_06300 [Acidobacteria bacterium]|nr:MAG: hypothetical protein DWQ30_19305 [Acidobacteriota bacterium]REK09656.1 MAG: hypothetical protein DWQ36_06300 [Acidobacteriota bacterium]